MVKSVWIPPRTPLTENTDYTKSVAKVSNCCLSSKTSNGLKVDSVGSKLDADEHISIVSLTPLGSRYLHSDL